jgi:hypothetical protein
MQASRAFIAMLVLVASAVAPVLSIPIELECVFVCLTFCNTADFFRNARRPRDCADVGGGIRQYGACKKRD